MSIEGAADLERLVELDDAALQARPVFQQALAPDCDPLPPVVDDRRREEVLGRRPCDRCGRISRTRQPVGPRPTRLPGRNQSAADSLAEGLDETLTLHRLGVYGVLGLSLKTTNCLESVNGLVEERCAKVDYWQTSHQRHRWLATALLDIEPRLRRVRGYRHLPMLRDALKRELKIDTQTSKTQAA